MKLVVRTDETLALRRFFTRLHNARGIPSENTQLLGIPDDVVIFAGALSKEDTSQVIRTELLSRLKQEFSLLWGQHRNQLAQVNAALMDFVGIHGAWLIKHIPQYTAVAWPFDEAVLFPGIITWAGTQRNEICVGIAPDTFRERWFTQVLIHELIHVNLANRSVEGPVFGQDTEEIADTLLVNRLLALKRRESGLEVASLRFPVKLRNYETSLNDLKKMSREATSYSQLESAIDAFLSSRGHTEVY